MPKGNTVAALFDDRYCPEPSELIHATKFESLFLTPGSDRLKDHNLPKPSSLGDLQYARKIMDDRKAAGKPATAKTWLQSLGTAIRRLPARFDF